VISFPAGTSIVDVPSRLDNKVARRRGTVFPCPCLGLHELPDAAPATVLVMNPLYRDDVERTVGDLGLRASAVVA
jgi:hypothetical protein